MSQASGGAVQALQQAALAARAQQANPSALANPAAVAAAGGPQGGTGGNIGTGAAIASMNQAGQALGEMGSRATEHKLRLAEMDYAQVLAQENERQRSDLSLDNYRTQRMLDDSLQREEEARKNQLWRQQEKWGYANKQMDDVFATNKSIGLSIVQEAMSLRAAYLDPNQPAPPQLANLDANQAELVIQGMMEQGMALATDVTQTGDAWRNVRQAGLELGITLPDDFDAGSGVENMAMVADGQMSSEDTLFLDGETIGEPYLDKDQQFQHDLQLKGILRTNVGALLNYGYSSGAFENAQKKRDFLQRMNNLVAKTDQLGTQTAFSMRKMHEGVFMGDGEVTAGPAGEPVLTVDFTALENDFVSFFQEQGYEPGGRLITEQYLTNLLTPSPLAPIYGLLLNTTPEDLHRMQIEGTLGAPPWAFATLQRPLAALNDRLQAEIKALTGPGTEDMASGTVFGREIKGEEAREVLQHLRQESMLVQDLSRKAAQIGNAVAFSQAVAMANALTLDSMVEAVDEAGGNFEDTDFYKRFKRMYDGLADNAWLEAGPMSFTPKPPRIQAPAPEPLVPVENMLLNDRIRKYGQEPIGPKR